ncbi:hypothetical protein GCM10009678_50470 [Actinomadura kijaniata]|uniref:Uncharacterized protein n=1 Tax=Actinomadura namibiensis TaxID=182080 RepID=A0A7W3QIQ6_ACTNM|nr:hypothetical protein [Actinomadura namibiensis]MBA8948581.1 hypothetical protein [Actinomadura namibiensis]
MIVIPRLLAEQVQATDEALRERLALDSARHGLDVCRDSVQNADILDACLDSARRYVDGEGSYQEVVENFDRSHEMFADDGFGGQLAWSVRAAVLVSAHRAFEEPGSTEFPVLSTAVDVAKEMQKAVGDHAALQAGLDPQDPAAKALTWHARWEEARWQLLRTIELVPNPHRLPG